jgi:hypothetical protein
MGFAAWERVFVIPDPAQTNQKNRAVPAALLRLGSST